jgi:hypothetical protein
MMATLTSGPRVAATRREEKGARLRPVDCWAGPLRLAEEELGSRAAEVVWANRLAGLRRPKTREGGKRDLLFLLFLF